MNMNQIGIIVLLIVLTLFSGIADAQGFVTIASLHGEGRLRRIALE